MEPIEALKRGDEEAIHWLVDSFSDRLLKTATLILGDEHLAEDAVQECFLAAITHFADFRGEASISTWLYTILLRGCQRQRRRNLRQVTQLPSVIEALFSTQGSTSSAPPFAQRQVLRQAIASLGYRYREVIVLFYYEELSIKEMANLLNEPEGTIKNRLHRARKKLKNRLEREEEI